MADECVSVRFDDGTSWDYCWEDSTPEPSWDADNVDSGLRRGYTDQTKSWRVCQYYVKGMPAICKNWNGNKCTFVEDNTSDNPLDPPAEIPSGYNSSSCDFLGRRHWCTKYNAQGEDNLEEWVCTAPNPYITGLGKRVGVDDVVVRAVKKGEIWGYNDKNDGTGTGQCDCYGMGRGAAGCPIAGNLGDYGNEDIEARLSELPIVCNFYRPWQMGFGIIDPHTKEADDVEPDGITATDQGLERASQPLGFRLPLNYTLYNIRAAFQTCQWWNSGTSLDYGVTSSGAIYLPGGQDIYDAAGRISFCKCQDSAADNYNTRTLEGRGTISGSRMALDQVQSYAGGPVCNGARPECPCYSGKWIYLNSERMLPGMPVTANQILELRYWAQDWETQEQYDEAFIRAPNLDDPKTQWIYTFVKWQRRGASAADSVMEGKRFTLCQPSPLHNKEFSKDYIVKEGPFNYAPPYVETGTTAPTQVHYPNLIRNPEIESSDYKQLVVTYPYHNDNVFNIEICVNQGEPGHIKRHNNIYGDNISCVGQTSKNKKVYVINTEFIYIFREYLQYSSVFSMPPTVKYKFYSKIGGIIDDAIKENRDYIKYVQSDSTFGFFKLSPVKLKYNAQNILLICVDYGDGTWELRWRRVNSLWCGGVIAQTSFEHTYPGRDAGYDNSQPVSFDPAASCKLKMTPMGSSKTTSALTAYSFENVYTGIRYYSYYKYKLWPNDAAVSITKWGTIGNSNKIFVEIDDINLNYIYNWGIESATLRQITTTDDDGNEVSPRETLPNSISFKRIDLDSDTIPPNACVFEPVDDIRIRFLPSEWELFADYYYEGMSDRIDQISQWNRYEILFGGGDSSLDVFAVPSYEVSVVSGTGVINVSDITTGPVSFLAYFHDSDGRAISTMGTKAIMGVVLERCRNVDIFYKYEAQGRQYKLMPESGFCIDIKQDLPLSDTYKHVEIPDCGDHEQSFFSWQGPMWYPYNRCRGYDMYDEFTVCNNCQAGYVGPRNGGEARDSAGNIIVVANQVLKRNDYRYCGPHKYAAFGDTRGNWAATCDCGCKFSYSDASSASVIFSGYGKARSSVDLDLYNARGWDHPPFGNDGRDLVEKFLSQDYIHHFHFQSAINRAEWMPMVMDNSSFFMSFDAFDSNPEDTSYAQTGSIDNFRHVHQLSLMTLGNVLEVVQQVETAGGAPTGQSRRFRWDDLFTVHHESKCSYPLPVYTTGSATKVIFYYFKDVQQASGQKSMGWAWQEYWRDIERDLLMSDSDYPQPQSTEEDEEIIVVADKFEFLDLENPKYIFSYYKEEYRLMMDEGEHLLYFTGPKFDEEDTMIEYPNISIDGINWRPFEIIYNTYGGQAITWKDEGGSANVLGSSDDDNPYEEVMGNDWLHDENILFDSEAVTSSGAAEAANRSIVTGVDDVLGTEIVKYFNRGIIANITRDKLDYLPKQEYKYSFNTEGINPEFILVSEGPDSLPESIETTTTDSVEEEVLDGNIMWEDTPVVITTIEVPLVYWAFSRLNLKGKWGSVVNSEGVIKRAVKPKISVVAKYQDDSNAVPRSVNSAPSSVELPGDSQAIADYEVDLRFLLGPNEMITNKIVSLTITLTGSAEYYIVLDSIDLYHNKYATVAYERVNLWERKYIASEISEGVGYMNLDGPGDNLKYHEDLTSAGLYFPFRGSTHANVEIDSAATKMRSVSCGVLYSIDVSIADITYDNLHEIEASAQYELYQSAYDSDGLGDTWTWESVTPNKVDYFLSDMGISWTAASPETFKSEKLKWEDLSKYKQFKQYDYWRPGGHFYSWDASFRKEKCTLFGPVENVFSGYYAHVDHIGIGNPLEVDASKPIDPGNSYYSLRFYTQQAKYDRSVILSGGDPDSIDRSDAGLPYNV